MTNTIVTAVFLLASFQTIAATIWVPTNVDTDFVIFGKAAGITTNGGNLAMFDDADFGGDALVIGQGGGHVVFSRINRGDWKAEGFDVNNNSLGFITLTNNRNFVLGMDWGVGYYSDIMANPMSTPDTFLIVFDGFDGSGNISGNTLAVDLAPIPVPAAVWLFGSGLLGLVVAARRSRISA